MGWCQAFGPQIREGCDHSMVAGPDRCSCPECGVVCYGKFGGCTTVWAAGPQDVTLRRSAREPSAPKALPGGATNGAGPSPGPAMPVLAPPPVSYSSAEPNGDLRPLLHALRAEMQVLSRKVDQIQQPAQYTGDASKGADRALAAAEALPGRIAKAVAEALREQHRAMQVELGVLRVQLAADIQTVHESLERPAASDWIIPAIDARFEWLVHELSERFVIFGNEIARINQHLTAAGLGAPGTNGHGEQVPPILREVDRLADRMEDIIETLRSPGAHTLRAIESP